MKLFEYEETMNKKKVLFIIEQFKECLSFEIKHKKKSIFSKCCEIIITDFDELKKLVSYIDNLNCNDDLAGHFVRCSCYCDAFNFSKVDDDVYVNYWTSLKVSLKNVPTEIGMPFKKAKELSKILRKYLTS